MIYIPDWVDKGIEDKKYYCRVCDVEIDHKEFENDQLCKECWLRLNDE